MRYKRLTLLVVVALVAVVAVEAQNPLQPGGGGGSPEIYSGRVPEFIRDWTRSLQGSIAVLSRQVMSGQWVAGVIAFLVSVVFGIVHIAGPGHGKVFAISYFSARHARVRDGLLYSGVVNAIDSLSALTLVVLGYVLLRATLPGFRSDGPRVLQLLSYGLIILFGILHLLSHLRPHAHGDEGALTSRSPWLLALSVGLIPCPVSTVLLVYGIANGVLPLMVLMVIGVSLGGFLTMSVISLAVIVGRAQLLERLHGGSAHRLSAVLEFTASGFIIFLGTVMFMAAV